MSAVLRGTFLKQSRLINRDIGPTFSPGPRLHIAKPILEDLFVQMHFGERDRLFEAWRDGRTGYPIVDAGMRQLMQTGWMHNRVRMIVASFLVKDLRLDWQSGERHFMRQLLDADMAANNGNWQWAAGTGCDAAPWFRVFNPSLQREKFDPEGKYVKKWVPEIHSLDYPSPMVDHDMARKRAMEVYKSALGRV